MSGLVGSEYHQIAEQILKEQSGGAPVSEEAIEEVAQSLYKQAEGELFPERIKEGFGAEGDGEIASVVLKALQKVDGSSDKDTYNAQIASAVGADDYEDEISGRSELIQQLAAASDPAAIAKIINKHLTYVEPGEEEIMKNLPPLAAK